MSFSDKQALIIGGSSGMELAESGIRVNAAAPAVVETPIYNAFIKPEEVDETLQAFNDFHPINRIGEPKDVAIHDCLFTLRKGELGHGCYWECGRRGDGRTGSVGDEAPIQSGRENDWPAGFYEKSMEKSIVSDQIAKFKPHVSHVNISGLNGNIRVHPFGGIKGHGKPFFY